MHLNLSSHDLWILKDVNITASMHSCTHVCLCRVEGAAHREQEGLAYRRPQPVVLWFCSTCSQPCAKWGEAIVHALLLSILSSPLLPALFKT